MSSHLSPERVAFAEAIQAFARRECGTREQRRRLVGDGVAAHSPEMIAKLVELGWVGVAFPEEYGGGGGDIIDACILLEELAYGQVPVFGLGISMIVAHTVMNHGTDEQKERIIGGFCRGEVSAVAMSEPDTGSDVGSLQCRAERTADGYVINGQKTWISCAHYADRILLVCRTSREERKHHGITMLEVPIDTPGVEIRPIDTLGGQEINEVFFDHALVSHDRLIGEEGSAWRQLMGGLNFERLVCAAIFLGNGRRAFRDALEYVSQREQFGQPIGQFQVIKHRIADLATELECAELLVYETAWKVAENPGGQFPRQASMAKLKATEVAKRVSIEGMQMLGAAGYTKEYDMESHLRSNIISTVFAGTSEIQREIIAKEYAL